MSHTTLSNSKPANKKTYETIIPLCILYLSLFDTPQFRSNGSVDSRTINRTRTESPSHPTDSLKTPITKKPMIPKFKQTIPQLVKAAANKDYFKLPRHKWTEGLNSLRFLPQPEDSAFQNFLRFDLYSVYNSDPSKRIELALDTDGEQIVRNVWSQIWKEEDAKVKASVEENNLDPQKAVYVSRVKGKTNPSGWELSSSPKVGGLAYCFDTKRIEVVVLPGTRPERKNRPKPRIGAGTKLEQLSTRTNIKGELVHGDICDIETGAAIRVNVTNAGTLNVEYNVEYDYQYSMMQEEEILNAIPYWENVITFATSLQLKDWYSKYLPKDVFERLDNPCVFGFEPF